jgi:radical SAM protein with 4Fe4S-binding SPASM domain
MPRIRAFSADYPSRGPKKFWGGAGLVSTAEDYARLCQMMLDEGKASNTRLLSRKTVELMFTALRDTSNLNGKCGVCSVRDVCGGSRARASATSGDVFAEEPCCSHSI